MKPLVAGQYLVYVSRQARLCVRLVVASLIAAHPTNFLLMIFRRISPMACALLPLFSLILPAQAASPEYPSHTLMLAASCAVCHGTDGHSASGMLGLAGMPASQFISRLQAYRNGSLPATVMHQHARGLTETEIQALAQYFAAQTPGKTVLEPSPQALEPDHE